MKNLAVITTHPIQYNAPLFRLLTERGLISIKVFYTWGKDVLKEKFDPGFNKVIEWDIPLLEGYDYTFVKNTSVQPGSHHFKGIMNPDLIENISKWKADAILVFGWSFKSHLTVIRYFHGRIPVYFRGDSTLLDEKKYSIKKLARSIMLRWVYRHVDKALYAGEVNKAYFKKFGLKENQLIFAPHAIDNKRFAFNRVAGDQIRISLNIPDNAIVLLFAGKLELKKNPEVLLKAFSELNSSNAFLIIAGNGMLEESLKTRYAGNNKIRFIPFQNQSQMPALYSACDIFILPSQGPGETWGLSVNEAMACGRAVLVSNNCGCARDLVQHGQNGFVFESGNAFDLMSKMKFLLKPETDLNAMGKRSLSIIGTWNYDKMCKALEELINS